MLNRAEIKRRRKRFWELIRLMKRTGRGATRGKNRRRLLRRALRLAMSIQDD